MTATADLCDERGEELACPSIPLRSFGARPAFDGPVRTVRCFEDNSLVREVLAEAGGGAVLVIDGGGSLAAALVGGNLAGLAVDNGWSGIVVHGAIRDVAAVDGLAIGVKALGTSPRKGPEAGAGEVDVPVTFGGATFVPGAHLWSDADGIVVEAPLTHRSPDERFLRSAGSKAYNMRVEDPMICGF